MGTFILKRERLQYRVGQPHLQEDLTGKTMFKLSKQYQ